MVEATVPDPTTPAPERELLRNILQHLGGRVRREQLETWFRSLDVRRIDDREIELTVTSQFVRDWLQKNYLGVLQEAVAALGEPRRRLVLGNRDEDGWDSLRFANPSPIADEMDRLLRLRDERTPVAAQPSVASLTAAPAPRPVAPGHQGAGGLRRIGNQLNPNYTFDRFVVGACNRLAHASSLAIGENPGCAYNPLFVHGNVGLGKSHLLQAICHTVLRRDQNARVLYMSCEDFTNAFIQAIQAHQLDAFRDYCRSADVLVIDDVQFLANKDKTQEEFFHTFNSLYDGQRQIVLSSDRPPVEIPTIEERLVSRFKWGLVAEVEAPCFDTRVTIVRRKAAGRGVELPDDVARFLAERVTTNIRELEGAVIKVVGFAAITDQPITLALAESCVRGMPVRHAQVSVDDVMTLVTTEFAITARELVGKSRTQTVSMPRQIAMFMLREHTENSLEDVGRIFGNRDHTTVLYAVNKIRERTQKDRLFKELLDSLSNRLLTRSFRA
ncbi:MAG: chromosomal replication initiator protein DnaA [Planctomycetes bacterium]|nr:chromosomal replication initiator protein DnaA [Planctomycetota bacterium]